MALFSVMTYAVHTIDGLPESPPAVLVASQRYPPNYSMPDVVSTEIGLWEVDRNVGGSYLSRAYWASALNGVEDYNVLFQQKDPLTGNTKSFSLHSSPDKEVSIAAYRSICSTLEPLVDDCTLLLTKELLKALIVPEPIPQSKLVDRIAELMELHPEAHSDWVKVLRALVLVAVGNKDAPECAVHKVMAATKNMSSSQRKAVVNNQNKEGKAPLHTVFRDNKRGSVLALMEAGADITITDEEGSNPLHLAAIAGSADSIRAAHHGKEDFLKNKSSNDAENEKFLNALNAPSKKGYTPLMLSVLENRIASTVTFLQAGSLPDVQNPKTGDTALHYAVELGLAPIVKALIVFGAQLEIRNEAGFTPLNFAAKVEGAKECGEILKEVIDLMHKAASNVSDKLEPLNIPQNSIFLLSMDGGGSRGLLLTQSLMVIQKRMKQLNPECCAIHKYFDYIAGTSAGGMAALAITCAGTSLEATQSSFFKAGDVMSSHSPTFPSEVIDRSSLESYGKDAVMTDVEQPRVIITTTLANHNPPVLHLMCNYGKARDGQKPPCERKVWEAGRCTSAAPFYFPPYEDKFIDGGIMANNPTLDAMAEIQSQEEEEKSGRKLALVVSLGTGIFPPTTKVDDVGIYIPNLSNMYHAFLNIGNTMSAMVNFLHVLINQATISNGQEVVRAEAWCNSLGVPYFRISPKMKNVIDITENDEGVLTNMMFEAYKEHLKNYKQIDFVARSLLSREADRKKH